jgi:hypothetical protein
MVEMGLAGGRSLLRSYPRTSRECIKGDSFAEEDFACGPTHGGAVGYGGYGVAFWDVPFDAVERRVS